MKKIRASRHNRYAVLTGLILLLIVIQGYANETGPDRCGKIIELIGSTNHYTNPAAYKVKNATDNEMYKEEIYGFDFTAVVKNLPSGQYTLSIFMAESYHSSTGRRRFNIYVEDILIVQNLVIVRHEVA